MKVTIFALAIAFCMVIATSNAAVSFESMEDGMQQYVPEEFADEIIDIEGYGAFSFFTKFFWVLKGALRTLKGVNCTIKEVFAVKNAAQNFVTDIQSCGTDAVNAFKDVIAAAQAVIATCNNIINLNSNVCNNDAETNGKPNTSYSCFIKLLNQILTLKKNINSTVTAIKNVPTVPAGAAACTNTAVSTLTSAFTSFPTNVVTCSKLTS